MLKPFLPIFAVLALVGLLYDIFTSKEERDRATRFRLAVLPGVLAGMVPIVLNDWAGQTTWWFVQPLASRTNAFVLLKFASMAFSIAWWGWFFIFKHDEIFPPRAEG